MSGVGPEKDKVFFGDYELLTLLGRGGMAETWRAIFHGPDGFERHVALKRILPEHSKDKRFADLFLLEAKMAAQLQHPHIARVYAFGKIDGRHFLSMELIEGVSLEGLLESLPEHRLPPPLALHVFIQTLEALVYAHTEDTVTHRSALVHRDLSPQNEMLDHHGHVKLIDFGVAKVMKDGIATKSELIKGKPHYMPPEQISGRDLDGRVDLFALGAIGFKMLAGYHPYHPPGVQIRVADQLFYRIFKDDRARIWEVAPEETPKLFQEVIEAMLVPERDNRIGSAQEALDKLDKLRTGGDERQLARLMMKRGLVGRTVPDPPAPRRPPPRKTPPQAPPPQEPPPQEPPSQEPPSRAPPSQAPPSQASQEPPSRAPPSQEPPSGARDRGARAQRRHMAPTIAEPIVTRAVTRAQRKLHKTQPLPPDPAERRPAPESHKTQPLPPDPAERRPAPESRPRIVEAGDTASPVEPRRRPLKIWLGLSLLVLSGLGAFAGALLAGLPSSGSEPSTADDHASRKADRSARAIENEPDAAPAPLTSRGATDARDAEHPRAPSTGAHMIESSDDAGAPSEPSAPEASCRVRVIAIPEGGIFIDGRRAGRAPRWVTLSPGTHRITGRNGARSRTVNVRCEDGRPSRRQVRLRLY